MALKYIVTHNNVPIIFTEGESHADVARGVGGAKSAGFVLIDAHVTGSEIVCDCYGDSVSLGIKSRPIEDTEIITRMFNREL